MQVLVTVVTTYQLIVTMVTIMHLPVYSYHGYHHALSGVVEYSLREHLETRGRDEAEYYSFPFEMDPHTGDILLTAPLDFELVST